MPALIIFVSAALAVTALQSGQTKNSLDFWVGDWDVFVGKQKVGTDRVVKELDGATIFEHWTDARGVEGKSLFYFLPQQAKWKQVWVVPTGDYKEKMSEAHPNGIRFSGSAHPPTGPSYPDRTTLTKMEGGRVHQVIEVSKDEGKTWESVFDAVYVPRK